MARLAWMVAALVAVIIAVALPSNSQDPAVPVSYRFTLAQDDSEIAKVRLDLDNALRRLAVPTTTVRVTCLYNGPAPIYRCTLVGAQKLYEGTYPLPGNSAFTTRYSSGDTVSWAPVSRVQDGAAEFKKLLDSADNRTLFDCANELCKLVVHTGRRPDVAGATDPGSDVLSICSVVHAASAIGPPRDCTDVGFSRGGETFIKAVIAQVFPAPRSPPPATSTPAPTPTPQACCLPNLKKPDELLRSGKHVGLVVHGKPLERTEVRQATCNYLAAKGIVCTNNSLSETFATAGVASRFFTVPPAIWFETFNLGYTDEDAFYRGAYSYVSSITLRELLVSPRSNDLGPASAELAALYRKNLMIVEKQALFTLCSRHNILLGSDNDERPTVFECYR